MNNYKIKVNDEAESKEVISLLVQLGYWDSESDRFGFVYTLGKKIGCDRLTHWDYYTGLCCKELTLPQLRDLVVLHRNDVKDATHTDKSEERIYLTTDKVIYYWQGEWCKSAINKSNGYENYIANSLTLIQPPVQEQGLISGADALRALADGKEVERKLGIGWCDDVKKLSAETILHGVSELRLKPRTLKLELEIPAPFEPKIEDQYWYLDSNDPQGYNTDIRNHEEMFSQFKKTSFGQMGVWRTEEEIKQVVAALRGGIKA